MTQPHSAPPQQLPPGTPLPNGDGVAGTWLATWTHPGRVIWAGWVATGQPAPSFPDWNGPGYLQSYYPVTPPDDAGPPPEGGGSYLIVRIVGRGGWLFETLGYPW
jgi:hypothetical protein